jgi:tryptophan-rich sensory protein
MVDAWTHWTSYWRQRYTIVIDTIGVGAIVAAYLQRLTVLAAMVAFFRYSKVKVWLLMPSLTWKRFAGSLNLAIWRLND